MGDADKVRGYVGPIPPEPEKDTIKADADKFKREMIKKVDESGESEKKEKRALKKQPQEEEEEEKAKDKAAPHPSEFRRHLEEDSGDHLMNISGGKRVSGSFRSESPPPSMSPGVSSELSHEESELLGGPPIERGPAEPPPRREPPPRSVSAEPPLSPEEERQTKPKGKEQDTSLFAGKTKRGELKKKKPLPKSERAEKHLDMPKREEKIAAAQEKSAPISSEKASHGEDKQEGPLLESEKIAEEPEGAAPPPIHPEEGKPARAKEEKIGEKETSSPPLAAPHTPPHTEAPPPIPQTGPTSYTRLAPQVAQLFDRMVGLMTIEQHRGVSTTTVTLDMPGSVFNGAQLVLKHFSTAPHAFNLELQGSPEALELFSSHMNDLAAAFAERNFSYQVNIQRPVLQARYRVTEKKQQEGGEEKN